MEELLAKTIKVTVELKRMRRANKRQRTIAARLQRGKERKASSIGTAVMQTLGQTLGKAARIVALSGQRKTADGQPRLCAWHAPEEGCIGKGKARTPYEYGVKVGIASTLQSNLIVGAKAFHGNPYDGHTLSEQLEQATILTQESGSKPATAFVDLGYRGGDADNPDVHIVRRGKSKRISAHFQCVHHLRPLPYTLSLLSKDANMGCCQFR